jgi:glycosyltransferase involved in cell wall biosynthesis
MTLVTVESEQAAQRAEVRRGLRGHSPIVCFANDWRGDPTSKHHIMRIFSEAADVFWVESSGMRRPKLTNPLDAKRAVARLRRSFGGSRPAADSRVSVVSPLSVPLPGNPVADAVNGVLYRRAVRRGLRNASKSAPPLLWVYNPLVIQYLDRLPHRGLVYHCVDRWWAFEEYDTALMLARHAELCRRADLVIASSTALLEDCREHSETVFLVPHGVEWSHFARSALEEVPRPADIADVEGPILGFFGLIADWVDVELIARIATTFPQATVVLIGQARTDVSHLAGIPNVRLLGQKPYSELPAYSAHFDVGLIPFRFNELTLAVNPIKLREYLSAGMPVVATALPDILTMGDNPSLLTAGDDVEFLNAIARVLEDPPGREERREAALRVSGESWLGRCADIARLVEEWVPA